MYEQRIQQLETGTVLADPSPKLQGEQLSGCGLPMALRKPDKQTRHRFDYVVMDEYGGMVPNVHARF